jgi:hypothetical protein
MLNAENIYNSSVLEDKIILDDVAITIHAVAEVWVVLMGEK